MNSIEKQLLFHNKLSEGKSVTEANNEIKRDNLYLHDLKKLKQEISKLETQKEKLKESISELKRKNSIEKNRILKIIPQHETYIDQSNGCAKKLATTLILSRVLHYVKGHAGYTSKDVADFCCINNSQAEDALNFIDRWIRK